MLVISTDFFARMRIGRIHTGRSAVNRPAVRRTACTEFHVAIGDQVWPIPRFQNDIINKYTSVTNSGVKIHRYFGRVGGCGEAARMLLPLSRSRHISSRGLFAIKTHIPVHRTGSIFAIEAEIILRVRFEGDGLVHPTSNSSDW